MSVSFDLELGEALRLARDRLRLEALGDAMAAWEREFGALTDAELAAAEQALDRAVTRPGLGAA